MPGAPRESSRRRAPPLRIGLAASRRYRCADGAAQRWLELCGASLVDEFDAELLVVGQTYDDLADLRALPVGLAVRRLPARREGGLIRLVAGIVDESGPDALDAVIYLLDPDDPTSVFPEGLALKRQCVIHHKPFIATLAHAREWVEIERVLSGATPDPALAESFDPAGKTLALVAHDAFKPALVSFARDHFALLDRFSARVATGTTGGLLNELAAARRDGPAWVRRLRSGPHGGDAEIAREILAGACDRVIFFEDPHVARQHEADIQLLERSARMTPRGVPCLTESRSAQRWAQATAVRLAHAQR